MPDDKEPRDLDLRQMFPWVELFRAFQIALEPYKLLLAAAAIVVLTFGWWLLALVFGVDNQFGEWPPNAPRGVNPYVVVTDRRGDLVSAEFWIGSIGKKPAPTLPADTPASPPDAKEPDKTKTPPSTASDGKTTAGIEIQTSIPEEIAKQPPVHLEPFSKFIGPVTGLFKSNPGHAQWWYCLFGLLMTLAVWAIFGGAITRIAAVQIARNEKIGILEALRFSTSKFLSFFAAPLIPFGGVALITVIMMIGGFVFLIPWVGEFLAAILWILALVGATVMALILIGLVGWPLMYATVSAEGSDSFDALSRCYAYVFQRPWHYLFYSLVAMIYGVLVIFFIVFVTSLFVYLAKWAVSLTPGIHWRATGDPVDAAFYYAPTSYDWQQLLMRDHPLIADISPKAITAQVGDVSEPALRRAKREEIDKFLLGKAVSDPSRYSQAVIDGDKEIMKRLVAELPLVQTQDQLERKLFAAGRERVYNQMNNAQLVGAGIVAFWLHLLFLLMLGFAYSYFWSVSTIIYFLLRKKVDDTDMDEVYLEEEEEETYPTPASTNSPNKTGSSTLPMVDAPRPPEPSRPVTPPPEPAKPTPPLAEPPKSPPANSSSDGGGKADGSSAAT